MGEHRGAVGSALLGSGAASWIGAATVLGTGKSQHLDSPVVLALFAGGVACVVAAFLVLRSPRRLVVLSAVYGLSNCQSDVTEIVRNLVVNGKLDFIVANEMLGGSDPCPQRRKNLVIDYRLGASEIMTLQTRERDRVRLP